MIGTTLHHYRIVRAIGRGGMGEVYAAEDTTLGRTVALKVLLPSLAADPQSLERFQREARAVAALSHPNIVTIHSVEEADGVHFITMELVDGRTLADVIQPGGLPPARLLDLAIPLADAVGAAHQRGLTHRDLKPANVMVGPDGRVTVLDFGLAKPTREPARAPFDSGATTANLTGAQSIVGTTAYMSPEQAEGRPVDQRTDIFALGVLLYEMASGTRPFTGDTAVSLISSILKDAPRPLAEIREGLPAGLERVIMRCLAKDPADRYQSALDLRFDLADVRQRMDRGGRRPPRRRTIALAAAAVVAVSAAAVWLARERAGPAAPVRATFRQITAQAGVEWFPSLSPDGQWVVYASDEAGRWDIYLQGVGGRNTLNLTQDSGADNDEPAFSPDGDRIAFRSSRDGGGIFVMARTGEAVRRVTRAGFNPAWSPDGTRLVYTTEDVRLYPQNAQGISELWTVVVATGEARRVDEGDAIMASWSPSGRRIAFTRRLGRAAKGDVWTIPSAGGPPTRATTDPAADWDPVWSPDGRYLYFVSDRGGNMNLWRVRIDEAAGRTLGEAEPITTPAPYLAHLSLSADGTRIAYTSALITANIQRLPFDPDAAAVAGAPTWVTTGSRQWSSPDPSPDGKEVAFYSLGQPGGDLYAARPDGTGLHRVTGDAAIDRVPRWSPDGRWIACFSDRSGHLELWKVRPDGSDLRQLTEGGGAYLAWSPDGARMATFHGVSDNTTAVALFDPDRPWAKQSPEILPPYPGSPSTRFLVNAWSPDGARLAGQLDAGLTGIATYDLRARTFERLTDFGQWPVWLPDSRRLLFVANGNAFYVVDTRTKRVRQVFSVTRDVLGPPRLTPDGRALYFSRRVTAADVWLLTFQRPEAGSQRPGG
jgi:Tol biopolymer transport system component